MKKLLLSLGIAVVIAPSFAFAAYVNAGRNVSLDAGTPVDQNVYLAGSDVVVSSAVNGDVLVAGSSVVVSSKVTHDIMAAGSTVALNNITAEDVRVAGANISVAGTISGELMAAGADLTVASGTTIAKDSYVAGGALTIGGHEAGSWNIFGSDVSLGGTTDGNVVVHASKAFTIDAGTVVKGTLTYSAPTEAAIPSDAHIGNVVFNKLATAQSSSNRPIFASFGVLAVFFTFWWLLGMAMMLLLAYLLWYVWRADMVALVSRATMNFWGELLRGFIFMIALPAAIILALISLVGIMAGAIAGLIYVMVLLLATPVTAMVAASLLANRRTDLRWYHILIGAIVLELVKLVPIIGWIVSFGVYLASLGALLLILGRKFRS